MADEGAETKDASPVEEKVEEAQSKDAAAPAEEKAEEAQTKDAAAPAEEKAPEPEVMASGTAEKPVVQVFESAMLPNMIRDEKTSFVLRKKMGDWTQGVFGDYWVKEKKGADKELENILTVKGEMFLRGSHHFVDLDGKELVKTRKQTFKFNPKEHFVHLAGETEPFFTIHKARALGNLNMTATFKDKADEDAEKTMLLSGNINTSEATITLGEGGPVLAKLHRPYIEGSAYVPSFEIDVQPGVDTLAVLIFGFLFTQQGLHG